MKKLLIFIVLFSLLIPGAAFAAELYHTYNHEITCDLVWGRATNTSEKTVWGYGYIKAHAEGEFSPVITLPGMKPVAPGGSYYLSWEPPDGFVGTVRVWVTFFGSPPGYEANGYLECHDYDLVFDQRNECEGNNYYRIMLTDYGQYVSTLYHSGFFTWSEPYSLESRTFGPFDLGEFGEYPAVTLDEPAYCLNAKGYETKLTNDCSGYEMVFDIAKGGTLILDEGVKLEDSWKDPYKLEAAVVSGVIEWLDGSVTPFYFAINEPAECFVCKITPLYRMVTAIDYDAHDWYLYDGRCYIIMHEDGTVPSVDRQADICSVCKYPDFIYEADQFIYDAYVSIDCRGNILYPDPLWDPEWRNLDPDHICRQPSCINK